MKEPVNMELLLEQKVCGVKQANGDPYCQISSENQQYIQKEWLHLGTCEMEANVQLHHHPNVSDP